MVFLSFLLLACRSSGSSSTSLGFLRCDDVIISLFLFYFSLFSLYGLRFFIFVFFEMDRLIDIDDILLISGFVALLRNIIFDLDLPAYMRNE